MWNGPILCLLSVIIPRKIKNYRSDKGADEMTESYDVFTRALK